MLPLISPVMQQVLDGGRIVNLPEVVACTALLPILVAVPMREQQQGRMTKAAVTVALAAAVATMTMQWIQ
jgi:hypothetical protein